jgi:hypothetical protein
VSALVSVLELALRLVSGRHPVSEPVLVRVSELLRELVPQMPLVGALWRSRARHPESAPQLALAQRLLSALVRLPVSDL